MAKPIGGRGVKAPYESTHVRVPKPIKAEVEALIEQFHSGGESHAKNKLTSLEDAVAAARSILIQKKSAKASMSKLLTAIYGQNVEI
ncbi:MAG: hypothetical protein F6K28_31280 [Microcoleus sp. SIO2G3]|nr:hypothetical protein [Microcoleus sp. SIO2G3]